MTKTNGEAMITHTAIGVTVVCAVILFTACTSNRPYRTNYTPCNTTQTNANCGDAVIELTPDYTLGFVEFDDQGWFWNRDQLKAVGNMVQHEAGMDKSSAPKGIIMVLFVHGWKNNASTESTNVVMFRETLQELRACFENGKESIIRKVLMLYNIGCMS